MYVLLVYDIAEGRVTKVMKICRQFLEHIQNSVFEGPLTVSQFKELSLKLKNVIEEKEDSIMIFKFRTKDAFEKEIIGVEKSEISNII